VYSSLCGRGGILSYVVHNGSRSHVGSRGGALALGVLLTWVKEDDGFQTSVLVVVDLELLEGDHQLVQDPHRHPAHLQLRAVPGDDVVIPCGRDGVPIVFGSGVCVCL